jgi:hypothetical protein
LRGGLLAVAVVAPVATFCHVSESAMCRQCRSHRSVEEWGFGLFSMNSSLLPVWPRSEVLRRSATLAAAFGGFHDHDWDVYSRGRAGIYGYAACGRFDVSDFGYRFEGEPQFRGFVLAQVRSGELCVERLREILFATDGSGADSGQAACVSEGNALLLEYDEQFRVGRSAKPE